MSALTQNINTWNEGRLHALIKSYDEKGFRASGQFEKDLEPYVKEDERFIKVGMLGSFYAYYMINGRKPTGTDAKKGNPTLLDRIKQWVKDKGLNINPYAVTKSIHKKGTKQFQQKDPKKARLLTDVINRESVFELMKIVSENRIAKLKVQISNILK